MKCITNNFKSIDFFGVNLSMNFLKRQKFKTLFGSLLSLVLFGYLLFKIYSFTIKTINRENFTQTNNIYYEDNSVNIKNYEFSLCFTESIGDYNFLDFSDYFYVVDSKNNFEIDNCNKLNLKFFEKYKKTPLENKLKNNCLCSKPKKDLVVFSDLIKANVTLYSLSIYPKAKLFDIDFSKTFIYYVNKNTYFDYSKIDPINLYLTSIPLNPQLTTQQIYVYFNKIKYSEIIDFDIFYQKTTDYEDYTITDNSSSAGETIRNEDKLIKPFFTFNLFPETKIYNYDITLLSMDNILATFNGVFQVLSMLLGFIGNFYNNIFFKKDFKNYISNVKEEKDLKKILKKIYDFNKFNKHNNYAENDIIGEISNLIDNKLVLKDNNYQENLVLNHSNISKNSKNEKNKSINELDNLENLDFEVSNISPKYVFRIENNPNETNNAAKSKNQTFIVKNNLILEENNKPKLNSCMKKENLIKLNNNYVNNIEKKDNFSLSLLENYVNSYEFLFDSFCQIEFLKTLLFDEHLYLNFKDLSKLYISMYSKQKNKYFDELKDKIKNNEDFKNKSKINNENELFLKEVIKNKIIKNLRNSINSE